MNRNWKRTFSLLVFCMMFMLAQTPISWALRSDAAEGILVMSEKDAAGSVITGFAVLEEPAFWFEGAPPEKELVEGLPAFLEADLIPDAEDVCDGAAESEGGKAADSVHARIPVTWKIVEDYGGREYYFYSARPVLPKGCRLAKDLDPATDVPWITIYRKAPRAAGMLSRLTGAGEIGKSRGRNASKSKKAKNSSKSKKSSSSHRQKKIYKYLTEEMDLNMAAASAVMTNLYAESGMQPNNLENTYNAVYGLSDREYTRRVSKGKKHNGRYVSGYGKTRYFTTDYSGYGICQWTSLGRRANLLERAVKKDTSIGNLDMQLGFLQKELKKSYPQVWATLRGVPNNAAGVYLAAMHFCAAFEIPANTNATAASRARTALSTYWKTYSGRTASSRGKSFLGICGYSYPVSVRKGIGVTCSGHVISNYTIKKVSARIVTAKGRVVCRKTKRPGTTVYSLYHFDRSMTFRKLSPGTYTYIIRARDSQGKSVRVRHTFRVTADGKTVTARGCAVKDVTASSEDPSQK